MSTKYENYTSGTAGSSFSVMFGQTFTPTKTHRLTSIKLNLAKSSTGPGTITVSIRNTSGGVPTGNDIASGTLDGSLLTTSPAWYEITLSTPIIVCAQTKYSIVINATTISNLNALVWSNISADGYSGGDCVVYSDGNWLKYDGISYPFSDLNFEEWGDLEIGGLFFCMG